ncbi:MAG: glycine cleavage system aminomethyltransferase GcvT, partial [SAR202 cluster bacterium]|nr:glycine cleavage system aminomethyltransferase GcvT [SAR202 cluster bacterium]
KAGLFDVSHMGRVDISGTPAPLFLDRVFSSSVAAIKTGRAKYGVICNREGGIIDDCILYRFAEDRFRLVPNASNTGAVLDWLARWNEGASMVNITEKTAMIAHQGPEAQAMLQPLTPFDLASLKPFAFAETEVIGTPALIARTGYTGEDGFEIMLPAEQAPAIWTALMERGAAPCGLGARDVLRLEAGLLLHGNDMSVDINPFEAGLDRFVEPGRAGYVARVSLRQILDNPLERKLVGFIMPERGSVARHGHAIMDGGQKIGEVTSGGFSPALDSNIGMGYVPGRYTAPGTRLTVDIRGRPAGIEVVKLPFYSRRRS